MITTVDHEIEKINRVQAVVETSMNQMVDTNREVERETNTLIEDLLQNRKTAAEPENQLIKRRIET